METNEIFCKIFQKDITEEGYIYFPSRMCDDSRELIDRSTSYYARKQDDSISPLTSHFRKMCDDLNDAYKRGDEGLQKQKAQELEAQIEKLEAQKKELNQKIGSPSL